MRTILAIDDDEQMRGFAQETLKGTGYNVLAANDGEQGLAMFKKHHVDLVITDLFMPEREGCETIVELRRIWPEAKIIAISGGSSITGADCLPIATRLGAQRTLNKPISAGELLEAVRGVLEE